VKPLTGNKRLRAVIGIGILAVLYGIALLSDFVAPYPYTDQVRSEPSAPASVPRFLDENGEFHLRPFIYAVKLLDARKQTYEEIRTEQFPVAFFVQGDEYTFIGLLDARTHLFGVMNTGSMPSPKLRLLGADQLGRDKFSRLVRGMRFSLLVTPAGAAIAVLLGTLVGAISGYSSKRIDEALMGAADTLIALPALILILAARAAFPLELPPASAALLLICIFGFTGWGEMARLVRGQVWTLRNREFVLAARASGSTEATILFRHIAPNIVQPVLVQATLMLPTFLLAEVSMSFLGVGLQEPEASLGNVLASASDLIQITNNPSGLLAPVVMIVLFLTAIRLLSTGYGRSAGPV
jgi:peptide/nickel transport system permease protein